MHASSPSSEEACSSKTGWYSSLKRHTARAFAGISLVSARSGCVRPWVGWLLHRLGVLWQGWEWGGPLPSGCEGAFPREEASNGACASWSGNSWSIAVTIRSRAPAETWPSRLDMGFPGCALPIQGAVRWRIRAEAIDPYSCDRASQCGPPEQLRLPEAPALAGYSRWTSSLCRSLRRNLALSQRPRLQRLCLLALNWQPKAKRDPSCQPWGHRKPCGPSWRSLRKRRIPCRCSALGLHDWIPDPS